jgi:hypothetical protein
MCTQDVVQDVRRVSDEDILNPYTKTPQMGSPEGKLPRHYYGREPTGIL